MKYALLLALALTGCVHVDATVADAPSLPEPPSTNQTDVGFNDGATVSYACWQSEVNPALVWDVCRFHNFSAESKGMCIKVSYTLDKTVVATSRTFCSGPVAPGETKENYAAFTPKTGRPQLEACGSNMIQCKLTAEEVVQ